MTTYEQGVILLKEIMACAKTAESLRRSGYTDAAAYYMERGNKKAEELQELALDNLKERLK